MEFRKIGFNRSDIGEDEIAEVGEALRSGWITTGIRTRTLERRIAAYVETGDNSVDTEKDCDRWNQRTVCLNSATAAEELNLRILGIGYGDEVIVPAYTYTATAAAAIHCGATVKFVDITRNGNEFTHMPEMCYDSLNAAITEKTKAIVAVDLAGIIADYETIYAIVDSKRELFHPMASDGTPLGDLNHRVQESIGRIAVIADAAHSFGASCVIRGETRNSGSIADFSSFSFHAVKNFTTAEGGASIWKPINGVSDKEIYDYYQLLSLHGQNKDAFSKCCIGQWEYDVIGPWYKCNMPDVISAIGLRQLDRYPKMLEKRQHIISRYDSFCDSFGLFHLFHYTDKSTSSGHIYLFRVPGINEKERNEIIGRMADKGVALNVHYKPLPMMTAYKNLGWNIGSFPNSYKYYENAISLPLHSLLSEDDIEYICDSLGAVLKDMRIC